jgi:hypothetical protein
MADGSADLCVCVLFYGADAYCHELAQRVLNAPMRQLAKQNVEFRFGLNAVGDATRQFVQDQISSHFHGAFVVDSPENIFKYPIMRRMFYEKQLRARSVMWFDDNSCIMPDTDVAHWLGRVQRQLDGCTLLGSVYTQGLVGRQADWIKAQPWYAGKEPAPYVKYVADAWWAMRAEPLLRFQWPSPDIRHHGGDVMLGELCRQQNLSLCHFRDNLLINANSSGVEGAGRRGFSAPPVGFDYAVEAVCD